jgi:hypothetical protein
VAEYGHVDASIPLSVRKPDAMGKLSDLLSMQRQAIAVQADKTALASAQQSQRQREGLASFDWSKLVGDDGTIDLNKIMDSGLREAAGDQFPQAMQQAAQIKQQQLAAKQTLVGLTDSQRKSFAEMVGALRSDPDVVQGTPEGKQKLNDALGQYVTMYGPDVENVVKAYAAPLMKAPPGKAGQILQNIQLQATSASDQASRQAPQYQSTGGELRNVNPYAQTQQAPSSIPLTIAPGQQSQVMTDQLGNPFEQRRDPRGNITTVRPLEGPASFGPGERQSLEQQAESNFRNVEANRIAASLAPQQLDQINKALKISEGVSTGGGGDFARKRASIESAIAAFIPGIETAVDDATKLQMLDKYLERIAADSARVLGANASTDSARESIARQNASTGYTRDAVQSVLEYAKAQTMAMEAKGDAQEKWLKQEGNKITSQHEFETKWRKAYDPLLFQLEALSEGKARDKLKTLSADQRKDLKRKYDELVDMGAMK